MEKTSKATMVALLASANIAFVCTDTEIRVSGGTGPNNEGGDDTTAVYYFDTQGTLVSVGVWDGMKQSAAA